MNRSKAKGTLFEGQVRDLFHFYGILAERLPSEGSKDRGDIWLNDIGMIIECKATKAIDLAGSMTEAKKEAFHAEKRWYSVIHKRRSKPIAEAYATMPLWVMMELLATASNIAEPTLRSSRSERVAIPKTRSSVARSAGSKVTARPSTLT